MPLTPDDVSNKRFTPVRLREGYDMGEVDQFLDEVEAELARLIKDNDDLREQLLVAQSGPSAPVAPSLAEAESQAPDSESQADADAEAEPEPEADAEPEPIVAAPLVAAADAPQVIKVATVPQASSAAARLLEIATYNADQLVDEAKADADKIVGEARTKAERLESESKTKADRLESDARTRSQMLDSEVAERRNQLFGDLEKEKGRLSGEIENLRAFEREYRSRLKSYFSQQLASLESNDSTSSVPGDPGLDVTGDAAPKRLRSLLGEDDS